jgi:hypothetical protein
MMAEHTGPDDFRLHDITVQTSGGSYATFVRFVESILGPLRSFFDLTEHKYVRFNYLGEWHSHHSFELKPSSVDENTIVDMLADPDFGANFVALLLIRLSDTRRVEFGLTVYTRAGLSWPGAVVVEDH